MTEVPRVSGQHPSEAFATLRAAGLEPVLLGLPTIKADAEGLRYRVATQAPVAGTEVAAGAPVYLACGTTIKSFGSLAGPPVAEPGTPAPDVTGVPLEDAIERVTAAGFIAVVLQPEQPLADLMIRSQEPEAGEHVPFREIVLSPGGRQPPSTS